MFAEVHFATESNFANAFFRIHLVRGNKRILISTKGNGFFSFFF